MVQPLEGEIRECKYCGQSIFFARTTKMADMPLETKAVVAYRLEEHTPGETQSRCVRVTDPTLFAPHWGNCPGAEKARKK